MIVSLCSKLFDPLGDFIIEPERDQKDVEVTRRANKYKTLDGDVVVSDRGFTYGDSDIVLRWTPTYETQVHDLQGVFRRQTRCILSMHPNVYECAFKSLRVDGSQARLELMVTASLNNA